MKWVLSQIAAALLLAGASGCWGTDDEARPHAAGCSDPEAASCQLSGVARTDGKQCSTPSTTAAKMRFVNRYDYRRLRVYIVSSKCKLVGVVQLEPQSSSEEYDAGDNQVWQVNDAESDDPLAQFVVTEGGSHVVVLP